MSTGTKDSNQVAWGRVRETIIRRWPHFSRDELAKCSNDTREFVDFVKCRVVASDDEVEAVVLEFAPQESIVERVAHAANDTLHQAGGFAQHAYVRADKFLSQRPTESVVTSFIAGIVLGAVVTGLWFSSHAEPSRCDRLKHRSWS